MKPTKSNIDQHYWNQLVKKKLNGGKSKRKSIHKKKSQSKIRSKPRYSRKVCKRGSVSRKSYKKKSGVRVKAGCVKSKGLRSKGKKSKVFLPKLKSGTLRAMGYSTISSSTQRHTALKKAVKKLGYSTTIKKLNAIRVLTKNTNPKNSAIYKNDIGYLQKTFRTQ